jgi:CheY-like chemotaxis protein
MTDEKSVPQPTVAALAHDIRNPLATIMSSVELIQALGPHAKEVPQLLSVVNDKVSTLKASLDIFVDSFDSAQDHSAIVREVSVNHAIPAPEHGAHGDIKILLVDDNESAADTLRQLLVLRGYTVAVAHSGAEGLQKALGFQPDVAILDIAMPGMDGYELCRQMHKDGIECTYIALTGHGQASDKVLAIEAGFDFHLTKPSRVNDIVTLLETIDSKTNN